nr:uncharacterized protein LOC102062070 [Zonotrichia albicollis]
MAFQSWGHNNLASPDLLEAGGWTQWLSDIPCKLHFPSNPWCNEGAEHGAYSLPALCFLTAPYGIGSGLKPLHLITKSRPHWADSAHGTRRARGWQACTWEKMQNWDVCPHIRHQKLG